ncbi:serine--tRNA ligase [Patescibacteria group bacterium]|nr:serine--tRNA ligase [Patescibacteria group bacterium]MBU1702870.1 serine--tRNA ligase [Patescibacteria group bacterium]MBU1953373.1 serine--tRNA ligase [Patescibacteria group bacterium]
MIDIKLLIEKPEETKAALAKKHYKGDLDAVLKMDEERRSLIEQTDTLKAEQNKLAKEIPQVEDKKPLLEKSGKLKDKLKEIEPKLKELEEKLKELLLEIPNPPLPSVPEGKDENDNEVVRTEGKKPKFDFTPLDHAELGRRHDLIDMETAANSSGTRFYYLKNEAVLLEFALIQHITGKLRSKGFTPILPPVLVREKAMEATGFFPADRNEIYSVNADDDNLFLVGTSEVPLCMLHADKIMDKKDLPKRYFAFSTCFRREAGTYGKDTAGIIRVHQFDKMEMFSFCHPDKSEEEHEFLLSIEEEIMQDLGFHYQVINICGGDLGAQAAKKYDIEVWIPAQNKYRELTSCSNCTDFQARRAKVRFDDEGKKTLVHTLNGTAFASTRTLLAIMENYQQKDGSILIPPVLRPYLGNQEKIG